MHASAALRAGADACILKQRPALARLPAAISKALMRRANGLAGLQEIRVGCVGVLSEVREELARRAPEVERRDTRHAIERSALEGQLRSVTDKLSQAEALVAELRGQLDAVDS